MYVRHPSALTYHSHRFPSQRQKIRCCKSTSFRETGRSRGRCRLALTAEVEHQTLQEVAEVESVARGVVAVAEEGVAVVGQ